MWHRVLLRGLQTWFSVLFSYSYCLFLRALLLLACLVVLGAAMEAWRQHFQPPTMDEHDILDSGSSNASTVTCAGLREAAVARAHPLYKAAVAEMKSVEVQVWQKY